MLVERVVYLPYQPRNHPLHVGREPLGGDDEVPAGDVPERPRRLELLGGRGTRVSDGVLGGYMPTWEGEDARARTTRRSYSHRLRHREGSARRPAPTGAATITVSALFPPHPRPAARRVSRPPPSTHLGNPGGVRDEHVLVAQRRHLEIAAPVPPVAREEAVPGPEHELHGPTPRCEDR